MNRLIAEFQRLYFLPEHAPERLDRGDVPVEISLAGQDGAVRAMVLGFERAADWSDVAKLYREVQETLELPAPAVSISGAQGYRLWFSLVAPVSVERALEFLYALHRRYLPELSPVHLRFWPVPAESASNLSDLFTLPPVRDATTGKWSAFIDPGLGSMFIEEPGLSMAPVVDRQADLLARLKSIDANAFEGALKFMQTSDEIPTSASAFTPASSNDSGRPAVPVHSELKQFADPKSFLLSVMNDPSVSTEYRIEAAKALLPFFENIGSR